MNRLLLPRLVYGGLKSVVPGLSSHRGTGGTDSAQYCYSVWLRHVRMIQDSGCDLRNGRVVEVGPGDSLGVGLAALLCGARDYLALDVVAHAEVKRNLVIFDELVELLRAGAPIPGGDRFPDVKPRLQDLAFPCKLLSPEVLDGALAPARVAELREAVSHLGRRHNGGPVRYVAPWMDAGAVENGSADLVLTQAVLEYIDDLDGACELLARWLRPGGLVSHQIDLSCHGLARTWDGHWGYSTPTWKLIKGRRPFFITRHPLSRHLAAMRRSGLELVDVVPVNAPAVLPRRRLSRRYRTLSDEDRTTRAVYVLARKPLQ
jgi:SAM-dependent methyltransferase